MVDSSREARSTIGETTYKRFKRMIDSLPESEQGNFTSRIIAMFAELHDLELRDVLVNEYAVSLRTLKGEG